MEINPSKLIRQPSLSPHPKSTSARTSSSGAGASSVDQQREAQNKLAESQKLLADLARESEAEIQRVRENHQEAVSMESAKQEESIQNQKLKGYETLRELQTQQQAELNRIRREGEAELAKLKNYYGKMTSDTARDGEDKLAEIQRNTSAQSDYHRRSAEFEMGEMKVAQEIQMKRAQELSEEKINTLTEQSRERYEKTAAHSAQATEAAQQHFEQKYQDTVTEHKKTIDHLYSTAGEKIREIRHDTAHKLAGYNARQQDPFYKLVDLGMRVAEEEGAYVLTAQIPEYEQKNVSISIKGNQLVISGYRRNEEKLELSPGRNKSTASYQSFHESFPLPKPVDAKRISRYFDGDQMTVLVPKKEEYFIYQPHQAKAPQKSRVEKPKFPENIPHVQREESVPAQEGDGKTASNSKRTTGSRTLT